MSKGLFGWAVVMFLSQHGQPSDRVEVGPPPPVVAEAEVVPAPQTETPPKEVAKN